MISSLLLLLLPMIVSESAFSSAQNPSMEILVQGHAVKEVGDILVDKYGVPKK